MNSVATLKAMTAQGTRYQKRFEELMGKKAPKFITSVISVTSNNSMLQTAEPQSILAAAAIAASMDLDVNKELSFSAIVPFYDNRTGKTYAQFQIMTRGYIQLAVRTGQYAMINSGPIYADELKGYDILSGKPDFVPGADDGYRAKDDYGDTLDDLKKAHVVGFFAIYRLLNGYEKVVYWPITKLYNHAKRYSKSFASDLSKGKKSSLWSTNFRAMAEKTVMKHLLSKWGLLSTTMQAAVEADQKVFVDDDTNGYADNGEDLHDQINTVPAEDVPEKPVAQPSEKPAVDPAPAVDDNDAYIWG